MQPAYGSTSDVLSPNASPSKWSDEARNALSSVVGSSVSLSACLSSTLSRPSTYFRLCNTCQRSPSRTLPTLTPDILEIIFSQMAGEDITTILSTDGYRRALPLAMTCKAYYAVFTRAIRGIAVFPLGFASRRASLPPPDPAPYLRSYDATAESSVSNLQRKNWFCESVSGDTGVVRRRISDFMIHRMLTTLHNLRDLELSMAVAVTDEGVTGIAQLCPDLRSFKVNSNHVITRRAVHALSTCLKLEVLDLNFCGRFGDDAAPYISRMPKLTSLSIARWKITDSFFKTLFRKDRCSQLNVLGLNGCEALTYKAVKYISQGTGLSLKHLNLRSCRRMNDPALEYIVHRCPKLEFIDISYNDNITPNGIGLLRGLNSLRNIQVSQCANATDSAVSLVCESGQLVSVKLSWCQQLTDRSAHALAACRSLTQVNLSGCRRLTDDAVLVLAELPSLERVKLTYCASLTDDSADFLANASNKPLLEVDLRRCRGIGSDAMDRLRKQCVLLLDSTVTLNSVP